MQRLNIQKGHAFILVYSITNRQSIEELRAIYKDIRDIKAEEIHTVPIMLVGSKCDESSSRDVQTAYATRLSQEWGCAFIETSAKTNVNVKEAFQELLKLETKNNLSLTINDNQNSNNSSLGNKNSNNNKKDNNKSKTKENNNKKCIIS